MFRPLLHLIDREGRHLPKAQADAVYAATQWVRFEYPMIDTALVSNWSEEIGLAVAAKSAGITSLRRWAIAAIRFKVLDYFRAGHFNEVAIAGAVELEDIEVPNQNTEDEFDRRLLFAQFRQHLDTRDRQIFAMLEQDRCIPEMLPPR